MLETWDTTIKRFAKYEYISTLRNNLIFYSFGKNLLILKRKLEVLFFIMSKQFPRSVSGGVGYVQESRVDGKTTRGILGAL